MNVFLLMVALVGSAEAPKTELPETSAATAAVVRAVPVLPEISAVRVATPPQVGVLPSPKSDRGCTLVGAYAKSRFLSGPWSASRRLEAARIRGDEDEVKRMEAMLDDFVGKAIFEEEP